MHPQTSNFSLLVIPKRLRQAAAGGSLPCRRQSQDLQHQTQSRGVSKKPFAHVKPHEQEFKCQTCGQEFIPQTPVGYKSKQSIPNNNNNNSRTLRGWKFNWMDFIFASANHITPHFFWHQRVGYSVKIDKKREGQYYSRIRKWYWVEKSFVFGEKKHDSCVSFRPAPGILHLTSKTSQC